MLWCFLLHWLEFKACFEKNKHVISITSQRAWKICRCLAFEVFVYRPYSTAAPMQMLHSSLRIFNWSVFPSILKAIHRVASMVIIGRTAIITWLWVFGVRRHMKVSFCYSIAITNIWTGTAYYFTTTIVFSRYTFFRKSMKLSVGHAYRLCTRLQRLIPSLQGLT